MAALFSKILNMSLTGSAVIGFVLVIRLLLRRAPKIYSYALWAAVLFRLLCPVSLSGPVSLLSVLRPEVTAPSEGITAVSYVPSPAPALQEASPTDAPPPDTGRPDILGICSWLWLLGVGIMSLHSLISCMRLQKKLTAAVPWRENVYLSDYINSPFVLGIFRPRIYMPSSIPEERCKYILAHERHHIRRADHILKLLAYGALCVHWFNPLVWLAFVLAGKDMEMSCDEAVIRQFGPQIRADYAASLLGLATHRYIVSGTPLAFGEGDTKGRVFHMAGWKQPRLRTGVLCTVLCAAALAACAVNPDGGGAVFEIQDLPQGYTCETDPDGTVRFTDGNQVVGGVAAYPIPEDVYDPADESFRWLMYVGIPDYEDESLSYFGYASDYPGGWNASFATDGPPEEKTVDRSHTFFVVGDTVYDIWSDQMLVGQDVHGDFVRAVKFLESTMPAEREKTEKDIAFEKCQAVYGAAQNGSFQIRSERTNLGTQSVAGRLTMYYGYDNDQALLISEVTGGQAYDRQAYLYAGGDSFSNEAHRGEPGEIQWSEGDFDLERIPSIASFGWERGAATYLDTREEESGTCIQYQINYMFEDVAGYDKFYLASFYFDPQGNFVKVRFDVNSSREDAFTVTESFVTQDPQTVAAAIEREYRRATGS